MVSGEQLDGIQAFWMRSYYYFCESFSAYIVCGWTNRIYFRSVYPPFWIGKKLCISTEHAICNRLFFYYLLFRFFSLPPYLCVLHSVRLQWQIRLRIHANQSVQIQNRKKHWRSEQYWKVISKVQTPSKHWFRLFLNLLASLLTIWTVWNYSNPTL